MKKELKLLVEELKENNEDYELYPTTKEMIRVIYNDCESNKEWLDVGCGTCNFKKYFKELREEDESKDSKSIGDYYVIEKSNILLQKLDKETICIGTDFDLTLLIDKPVDNVFCNPPYSKFKEWVCRIVLEANCNNIYLVIPQRWKEDEKIKEAIEESKSVFFVLGSFDFLNAERSARAKVDVVKISRAFEVKGNYYYRNTTVPEYNNSAFDKWFDEIFAMREKKDLTEYQIDEEKNKEVKQELARTDVSKAKILVDLYNKEMSTFYEHFKAICSLDVDVLETINITKDIVKKALKKKALGTKERYWKLTMDELEEVTERLTHATKEKMLNRFTKLKKIDFTLENIYPFILWVLKNAGSYYDEQLLSLFNYFTNPENIVKYKSNQKIYKLSKYYNNTFEYGEKVSHYTLSYRLICSKVQIEEDRYSKNWHISDICTVAKNLGFDVDFSTIPIKLNYGNKEEIKYKDGKVFMTFRCYKNNNMHVKFDIEFTKAFNVEASRLAGWLENKEDISKEFPSEMAKGAEKYFKVNRACLSYNSTPLLTVKKE